MKKKQIPETIMKAASALLRPYGVNLGNVLELYNEDPIKWEGVIDAAKRVGLSAITIRRLIDEGKVRGGRTESKRFIDSASLDCYLIEEEQKAKRGNA